MAATDQRATVGGMGSPRSRAAVGAGIIQANRHTLTLHRSVATKTASGPVPAPP